MGERESTGTWTAALAFCVAVTGCARPAGLVKTTSTERAARPVVLVTLDTVRADRLGCYGAAPSPTPHLDRLAGEGVRLDVALSPVPLTLPAHATLFTGRGPQEHGVRDNGTYRLAPEEVTLAERFADAGYATAAFVGAFVLDRRFGTDQGFGHYDDALASADSARADLPERRGDLVVDAALAWLRTHRAERAEDPFLLWVHLYDPHAPYSAPAPFGERFADRPYDGEVAFADAQVGRLLDALSEHGLADRALVCVVADHGEGLGDHGEETHGLLLYEEVSRVPWILRCPELLAPGVVEDVPVSLSDVAPTLLRLVGLAPQQGAGEGRDLTTTRGSGAVYLETLYPELNHGWSRLLALRDERYKYIEAPRPELYDLRTDPGERDNLIDGEPAVAARLAARLRARAGEGAESEQVMTDAEALAKLRTLGYSSGRTPDGTDGPLPDPKDRVAAFQESLRVLRELVQRGELAGALERVEEALGVFPGDAELWSLKASLAGKVGDVEEGLRARLRALELMPRARADHWVELARYQYLLADWEGMEASLKAARRLEPENGGVLLLHAQLALDAGDPRRALEWCEAARASDGARVGAQADSLAGQAYVQAGERDDARAAFERALSRRPDETAALVGLAQIEAAAGRRQRAAGLLARVPETSPTYPQAQAVLVSVCVEQRDVEGARRAAGRLGRSAAAPALLLSAANRLALQGERDLARELYEALLARDPDHPLAHYMLASLHDRAGRPEAARPHWERVRGDLRAEVAAELAAQAARLESAGRLAPAAATYAQLLDLTPEAAEVHARAARVLALLDRHAEARTLLERGLAQDEDCAPVHMMLAWLLATAPDPRVRDGARALEHARRAGASEEAAGPALLDLLAAAYAELGRFEEAVGVLDRALARQPAAGLAEELVRRRAAYAAGRAWRDG